LSEYGEENESGAAFQWRDLRKRGGADTRKARPNMYFPIYANPETGEVSLEKDAKKTVTIFPAKSDGTEGCWRWGKDTVEKNIAECCAFKVEGKDKWNVSYRVYLEKDGKARAAKPKSIWMGSHFSTDSATKALRDLIPGEALLTPKPLGLIKTILQQSTADDDVVLDFFAGSGTTGQAVYEVNQEDGGTRKYILVQLPEPMDHAKFRTITDITKERLRQAAKKLNESMPLLKKDMGFRVFKLASSNIRAWEPDRDNLAHSLTEAMEHLKTDRSEQDILFEVMLKFGLDLTIPIEEKEIAKKRVYSVGAGSLMACFAKAVSSEEVEPLALGMVAWHKELAPLGESVCIFRDSAFSDDVAKTNLSAILEQNGLQNVRSL